MNTEIILDDYVHQITQITKERDELKDRLADELKENLKLFDLVGLRTDEDFHNDTSTAALARKFKDLRTRLDDKTAKCLELQSKCELIENDTDEEWLSAIGNAYTRMFGKPWDTKDGETREEGLIYNIGALFQIIEDNRSRCLELEAKCAEMREVIRDTNYHDDSHDEHPNPDCDVCHALSNQCGAGLLELAEIGRKWRENSSLEEWFPITAERHKRLVEVLNEIVEWRYEMRSLTHLDEALIPKAKQALEACK